MARPRWKSVTSSRQPATRSISAGWHSWTGRRASGYSEAGTPTLSRWFESTLPGLFFVGPSAANAFGPLLRFARGAEFAVQALARRLH